MISASDIIIRRGYVPPYGGSGIHWIMITWNNILLDKYTCRDEFSCGYNYYQLEQKWKHDWEDQEFNKVIKDKPRASTPCHVCGQHTLDGSISQYNLDWCKRPECEKARKEYSLGRK